MDTKNRSFLDLLPVAYQTLDSWHMQPPFPLLVSGRYMVDMAASKYEATIEFITDELQQFDQLDLEELFVSATKCYAIYRHLTDEGAADSDVIRMDFARLAYQLCLNFRDAIEHLDLHDDDDAEFGFHYGVDIKHYN